MSSFTRVGTTLWEWEPFITLEDPNAKILWLALYTSNAAKRWCPGLWHGPVSLMADAAKLGAVDTQNALGELIRKKLVEFDSKNRVLRFTELPDHGDWPSTPSIMFAWWKRFNDMPACDVRDAWVPMLRWMIERGARDAEKNKWKGKPSPKHEEAWAETFGTIVVPLPRRRGMRASASNDPQISLFGPSGSLSDSDDPVDNDEDQESPSASANQSKGLIRESLPRGSVEGEEDGEGAVDFSSLGAEADQARGPGVDLDPAVTSLPGERDLEAPVLPRTPTRPKLALVPPPPDLSAVQNFLDALAREAGGTFKSRVREGTQDALCRALDSIAAHDRGPVELAMVGQQLARAPTLVHSELGDPTSKLCAWLVTPGAYQRALEAARTHEQKASDRSAMLAESMKALGMTKT